MCLSEPPATVLQNQKVEDLPYLVNSRWPTAAEGREHYTCPVGGHI
jgi:hypothetical protein